jgi:hypothetical protein
VKYPDDARGMTALVLAVGIALAICAVAVGAAVHEGTVSAEESTLISTVLGAAVGALATFLGTRDGHEHNDLDAAERAELERYRHEVVPAEVVEDPTTPLPPPRRPDPF